MAPGGGGFDTAWLPSWNARLAFRLDGLGALYAVLATGIGPGRGPRAALLSFVSTVAASRYLGDRRPFTEPEEGDR